MNKKLLPASVALFLFSFTLLAQPSTEAEDGSLRADLDRIVGLIGSGAYVRNADKDRITAMVNVDVITDDGVLMYGPTSHGGYLLAASQGREVVVLPTTKARGQVHLAQESINGYSFETSSQRIHVIDFEGKTFRAATPLEGPSSRIAFDPSRRAFAPLLPSIRVELDNEAQLESITELTGATKSVFFESSGFAIVELPETLHPVEAIARLESASGQPKATIRLRGPPIEWR